MKRNSSGNTPDQERRSATKARHSPTQTHTTPRTRQSSPRDPSPSAQHHRPATAGAGRGSATRADAGTPSRAAEALRVDGTVRVHPRGFGFLEHTPHGDATEGAAPESSFIPPPELDGFLDGDVVTAALVMEADGRSKVESLSLISRARTHLYGIVEKRNSSWHLRVDPHVANSPWVLVPARSWELSPGDSALAEISASPKANRARAIEAFEDPYSPEAIAVGVSVRHGVPLTAPEEDAAVAAEVVDILACAGAARQGAASPTSRIDLRDVLTLTIDADHSRDLDDALSVEPADANGVIRVSVHIADVSAHVIEGSAIDRAARDAATSVYLGEWVRPMLPRDLSESALSLIPGCDRDTLSITLSIDQEGSVTASDVFASRIRSDRRLSYLAVAGLLHGDGGHEVPTAELCDAVFWLHTAASRIGVQRERRGGISSLRMVDGSGDSDGAEVAHDLIERLMVAANEAVGGWLAAHEAPGPYRGHPAPAPGAGEEIDRFASSLGFRLGLAGPFTPHSLSSVEAALAASKDDRVAMVWELLLSHLGRASYRSTPAPHFGLASETYLHFTSPLRRYADLEVHRRCKEILAGIAQQPSDDAHAALYEHINDQTRTAAKAERDLVKTTRMAEISRDGVAKHRVWEGRIVGFAKPGVRVAFGAGDGQGHLTGLVKWRAFDRARYEVDEGGHSISSPGQPTFELGQLVRVKISALDCERGDIDLSRLRD